MKPLTQFCLLFSLLLAPAALYAQEVSVGGLFEDSAEASRDFDNPFLEVTASAVFTSPRGVETTVPAFWDGGRTWRVRFSPDEPGAWMYRWLPSGGAGDLPARSGSFVAARSAGANNRFLEHGFVKVAQGGRHFAHADGTPFFWLGDTAWNGLLVSREDDWDEYLDFRAAQGFTVAQVVALPWRSAAGNEFGRPAFYGRAAIAIDPAFFQRMDERMEAIGRHGMLAAVVMFWTHSQHVELNPGMSLPEDQLVALGRYLIARYSAYPTAWLLGGDGDYRGERGDRWKRIGRALFGAGAIGQRRPVTMHPTYWAADQFASEDWWDFNGYQSGHNRLLGLQRVTQGEPTEFWRSDSRPVLNLEPNYEAHRNRAPDADPSDHFDALDVRRQAWASLLGTPPAGLTYGVHGVWAWHPRPEEPMTHPGTGVGLAWFDAMKLPGSGNLAVLAKIFAEIDWPNLRPEQTLLKSQPGAQDVLKWISVARSGSLVVAYTPGETIELNQALAAAEWRSPRNGSAVPADPANLSPPNGEDWVLLGRTF